MDRGYPTSQQMIDSEGREFEKIREACALYD